MRCTSATSKARRALDRRRVGYASAWARKCGPAPPRGGARAPPVLAVVSAAGMGLVCGFTARLALRRSRRLLREAAALAALALGLVALGAGTSGLAGIDPLRLSSPRPQWAGLAPGLPG